MSKFIAFTFVLLFIFSCKQEQKKTDEDPLLIVDQLFDVPSRKNFLDQIHKDDAHWRELLLITDRHITKDSPQYDSLFQNLMRTDELNKKKVEAYLKRFSYPDVDTFGVQAALTPWLVMHHFYHVPTKEKYIPLFMKAMQDGNITTMDMVFYLNGIYNLKNKHLIEFSESSTPSEKLKIVMDSLKIVL